MQFKLPLFKGQLWLPAGSVKLNAGPHFRESGEWFIPCCWALFSLSWLCCALCCIHSCRHLPGFGKITIHEPVFVATSTARNPFLQVPAAAVESGRPGCDQCGLRCVPIIEALSGAGAELGARRMKVCLAWSGSQESWVSVCGWSSQHNGKWVQRVLVSEAGENSRQVGYVCVYLLRHCTWGTGNINI